ncbi:hypothetical protein niasHT_002605 [Heterodera trifolii]|uniref:Uncharacterized protein n=1 Tax=Heterodera trifolii TaxID=157864 RepID=A0ABD2M0H0_9BILA
MADYCSNGGTVAAVAPSAAVNMGGTVPAVDAGTVGGGAYCGAAPPLPAVMEGKNGAAAGAGAGAVQNDGADEKAGKLLAPNPSNSMPQQQQRNTTAYQHDNAHHAEAVQQHCQPAAINHHHQRHHRNSVGTNGAGVPPPATTLCQNGTEIEPPPQQQHEFGTAPNSNSNCFQPWLTDAEHHHHQFMHNFAMLSPPPFPMVVIPPTPTAAPFDYGSTLMPPAPPPPMAYPTPQGGRQSDLAARDEQQQQFFGTLYDSIAAVALAAGNGQFGPLMPPMMPTATTAYGDSSVPVPPPTDGSEENNNNDFYVYQHQLNIALGGHYPPPPIAALYPPGIEYGSPVDGEQHQHHHYGIDGGIANFELYTQHHPITPTTFLYPPIINGGGDGSGEHEYGSNNGFYTVGHQHQLLHNQWKQSLAMAAVATVGKAAARAQNAGGGGGHKRGADGKPKTSNTSSSGHLTVPSTSRRSSSASTVKAHLSSPTVSPVHSNGPAEYTSSADQFFPLLAQLGPAQRLTSAVVRDYLSNPARYDCVLWMYHAKVAQKSYGTEKRFFCPPPCIYLMGEGWRTRRKLLEQLYRHHHHQNSYKSSPNASGDPSLANIDEREKFVELCASIVVGAESATTAADDKKQNEQTKQHHLLDFSNGKDYSAAKALHISDTDKRKYFHLNAHFGYACGALELGTFASQRIKVISKPSKKKQSMKSSDCKYLCVGNKSKIALFNRLRSQTVSTRYLHVDEKISTNQKMHEPPAFVASSTKWGAFHINVVDQPEFGGQQSQQQQQQHTVTYGSVIQLVDSQTEMRLPLMRIRKVDKQHVLLDPAGQGEPVSQLHKCAFQMVDVASNGAELFYLCLSQDKIIQFQAIQVDAHRHQISDGAAWTIISTDKAEYRWAEPLAANGSISPKQITPVPQLHSLNMLDASQKLMQVDNCRMTGSATIELNGTNFTSQLRVWFGATPAETIYCTKERLSCAVPSLYTVCKHLGCTVAEAVAAHAGSGGKLLVPLLLARDEDGILYPTPHTFPYQLQTPAVQSESSAAAMNGGVGTAKICAADPSALAKNGGTLCNLEETIPERFFTENRANGIGEAQQLLMMHNAN